VDGFFILFWYLCDDERKELSVSNNRISLTTISRHDELVICSKIPEWLCLDPDCRKDGTVRGHVGGVCRVGGVERGQEGAETGKKNILGIGGGKACHYARKYMVPLEGQHLCRLDVQMVSIGDGQYFLCACVDGTGERIGSLLTMLALNACLWTGTVWILVGKPLRDSISIFQNVCWDRYRCILENYRCLFVGTDKCSLVDMCRWILKKPFGWTAFKMLVGILADGYWKDLIGGTACL
jgi:hypothetical protein